MSPCFQFVRGALFAAAACVSLVAPLQIASAQQRDPGDYNGEGGAQSGSYSDQCSQADRSACQPSQPIPYTSQQLPNLPVPYASQQSPNQPAAYADQRQGGDGGPPPPPPPPPAPTTYIPSGEARQAASNYGDRAAQRAHCQMVEDRVLFPDGTSEISSVQACRDRGGHWYVAD